MLLPQSFSGSLFSREGAETAPSDCIAKGGSDATQVRQKFSHGRTRVVEVVAKKPVKRGVGTSAPAPSTPPPPRREVLAAFSSSGSVPVTLMFVCTGAVRP